MASAYAVGVPLVDRGIWARHKDEKKEKSLKLEKKSKGFGGKRKEELWRCAEGCGACCKLDKGPSFATPEEIFTNPSDVEVSV